MSEARSYRCFHCEEVFTGEVEARAHFGRADGDVPACQIKGSDGGLIRALRDAEQDAADAWAAIHEESTEAARSYQAQASRHRAQLTAVEQAGYDRGLADGQSIHPADEAERFIQAAIDSAPEPLRRLGEWLANKLDEDDWKTADRLITGAALKRDIAFAVERMREGLAVRRRSWPLGLHVSIVRPGRMIDVHTGDEIEAEPFVAIRTGGVMAPHQLVASALLADDWELFTPTTEGTA